MYEKLVINLFLCFFFFFVCDWFSLLTLGLFLDFVWILGPKGERAKKRGGKKTLTKQRNKEVNISSLALPIQKANAE